MRPTTARKDPGPGRHAAPAPETPRELLVVGWFPGADDPIAGRFVADQVAALAATGRVAPSVVSFEPLWSSGDRALRTRAAKVWPRMVAAAAASGRFVAPEAATGPAGIPVLRLGVAGGTTLRADRDNQAVHRARALEAFLGARGGAPWPLIHAHAGYPEGAAVADVATARGIPFVITELASYLARQLEDPILRERYGWAARAAARVIALGPSQAREILHAFPDLQSRLRIIPYGVDLAAVPVVGPDERDPDELLWVGYRRASKGIPTLLRAFALVRKARPTTTLRLLGRSPTEDEEETWHRLAGELGVSDAVRFDPPSPDRDGVARAMVRAACFVHPSTFETMGVVAVEALASGLPVVATDSGGVTEIMGDQPGRLGALVPAEDPDALAAAILATLARRGTFDPRALRGWVEERYSAQVVASRLADLYDEVLAERVATGVAPAPRPAPRPARNAPEMAARRASGRLPPGGRVVVVAFDRPALDLTLPRWPAWVLGDALIVTRGPDFARGRIVSADLDRASARLMAWAERPRATSLTAKATLPLRLLIRRAQRARLERMVLPALQRAVEAAVSEVLEATGSPALVVCLGGIDVLAAEPAAASGRAVIAPGALRWLGDARWSGQAPAASSA